MSTAPAPSLPAGLPVDDFSLSTLIDAIHVWVLPTSTETVTQVDSWLDLLSTDEVARAGRFHFAHHAAAFVANRARLRLLLGSYLQQDPASIAFVYGAQGKPGLAGFPGNIDFNLSHTTGAAVVAITSGRRVGTDIELCRPMDDLLDVARLHFSASELDEIESCIDPEEQHAAFYRCWTRKEAFLKALGDGLTRPLDGFTVSCGALHPKLLDCRWDTKAPGLWQISNVVVELPGTARYTAALAYEGRPLSNIAVMTFDGARV